MRNILILLGTTSLAACSGGGPQTAGGVAVGSSGTGGGTTTATDIYVQFAKPTVAKTYSGVGGSQVYSYITDSRNCCNQQAQTFASNSSTVRDSKLQITYDPRAAIFTLIVRDPLTGASTDTRFQDPGSRTDFGGAEEPQWGVPDLATFPGSTGNPTVRYVQAGDGDPLSPYDHSGTGAIDPGTNTTPPDGNPKGSTYQSTTFFYEPPGTTTKYVSFAGYARNAIQFSLDDATGAIFNTWKLERGAFAYGALTDINVVPKTGTGTYSGSMLATMVYNPTIDGKFGPILPTFFQWIYGTSTTTVDFASLNVGLSVSGTVGNPFYDRYTSPQAVSIAAGTSFTASGTATIDLVKYGGFTGQIQSAVFGSTLNGSPTAINVIGSSIDGAFFGPKAEEVGGSFHIVGGTPDQRIDVLGAFTGK
jgi:C-lobe and N-lobe beta barrels of Tf-binding protein B